MTANHFANHYKCDKIIPYHGNTRHVCSTNWLILRPRIMESTYNFRKYPKIPKHILMPIIIVLSVVGAYAINNSVADIYYMMGFGIFGYFLKLYHFPSAPMILGVILSQLVEQNYRRGVSMVGNNLIAFIIDLFANPISIVLIIMIGLMLITQSKFWINFREKREKAKDIKISE